ncbi:MAG: acyltransferase [Gammaproteobacteria bacterium]|nr:acyltransferase [Gammaproteobacteria bacterium]
MISYRADIDGMRALAVLAVLSFHSGLPGFSGGFVGVDIFYVISGYLITSILQDEMTGHRFSMWRFYERRARRLLPALFTVLAVCLAVGYLSLLPEEMEALAESAAATVLFVSNIYFWSTTGYFQPAAETMPLLHTWSLAVEEQFYILYPALLYVLYRDGRPLTVARVLLVLAVLSFVICAYEGQRHAETAFYWFPFRAWELLAGAWVAVCPSMLSRTPLVREAKAVTGLALIIYAFFSFDDTTPFPGVHAAVPVLGSVLLISSGIGHRTFIARLLSLPLPVSIGLRSYSLYLWHWPVITFLGFAEKLYIEPLPAALRVALIFSMSLALATFTFRLVEEPIRQRRILQSQSSMFAFTSVTSAGIVLLAMLAVTFHGIPTRFSPETLIAAATSKDLDPMANDCNARSPERIDRDDVCRIGSKDGTAPSFLLWGDSHAYAILPGVNGAAVRERRSGHALTYGGCPPVIGMGVAPASKAERCMAFNDAAMRFVERHRVEKVLLAGRWRLYAEGSRLNGERAAPVRLHGAGGPVTDAPSHLAKGLIMTVSALHALGTRVVVISQVPAALAPVPDYLVRRSLGTPVEPIEQTVHGHRQFSASLAPTLAGLEFERLASVFDPAQTLCATGRCLIEHEGRGLYVDTNHLSRTGAELLTPALAKVLRSQ